MHAGGNRWTDDMTIKFIHLYRERPCLWQTDNLYYKCRLTRNDAVRSLVVEMGIKGFDTPACKLKIKNIRSHYCQELKKIYYSTVRREDKGLYQPSLVWFPIINGFLRNYVHQMVDVEADEAFAECKSNMDDQHIAETDITPSIVIKQEPVEEEPMETVKSNERRKMNMRIMGRLKRLKRMRTVLPQETEFDVFCRSVALQLNNMPIENALRLQLNIQNLVTEERLKCVHESMQ